MIQIHKYFTFTFLFILGVLYFLIAPMDIQTMKDEAISIFFSDLIYEECIDDTLFVGPNIAASSKKDALNFIWVQTKPEGANGQITVTVFDRYYKNFFPLYGPSYKNDTTRSFLNTRKPTNKYDAHCKTEPQTKDSK